VGGKKTIEKSRTGKKCEHEPPSLFLITVVRPREGKTGKKLHRSGKEVKNSPEEMCKRQGQPRAQKRSNIVWAVLPRRRERKRGGGRVGKKKRGEKTRCWQKNCLTTITENGGRDAKKRGPEGGVASMENPKRETKEKRNCNELLNWFRKRERKEKSKSAKEQRRAGGWPV